MARVRKTWQRTSSVRKSCGRKHNGIVKRSRGSTKKCEQGSLERMTKALLKARATRPRQKMSAETTAGVAEDEGGVERAAGNPFTNNNNRSLISSTQQMTLDDQAQDREGRESYSIQTTRRSRVLFPWRAAMRGRRLRGAIHPKPSRMERSSAVHEGPTIMDVEGSTSATDEHMQLRDIIGGIERLGV